MAFKGALIIDTEKCKGCGVCIMDVPTSASDFPNV